jgi:hypothetical protein
MKNIMLVVLALVLVSSMAFAQSAAITTITINAAATALGVVNSDGGVDAVLRGVSYTVVYDPYAGASTVMPNNNGELPNGDVGVDISGDVATNVVVEMSLPDHLLGTAGTSMAIAFPATGPGGGVRVETGGFFNPNVNNTFNLGSGGTCNLRLGYMFTVPTNVNIAGDAYVGQILTNAYYTGL